MNLCIVLEAFCATRTLVCPRVTGCHPLQRADLLGHIFLHCSRKAKHIVDCARWGLEGHGGRALNSVVVIQSGRKAISKPSLGTFSKSDVVRVFQLSLAAVPPKMNRTCHLQIVNVHHTTTTSTDGERS